MQLTADKSTVTKLPCWSAQDIGRCGSGAVALKASTRKVKEPRSVGLMALLSPFSTYFLWDTCALCVGLTEHTMGFVSVESGLATLANSFGFG